MKAFVLFLAFTNCTFTKSNKGTTYQVINSLWNESANVKKIKVQLHEPDLSTSTNLIYYFSKSKVTKINLTLNADSNLKSAFMFLNTQDIESFKATIQCDWSENINKVQKEDLITLVHEGHCKNMPIKFKYSSSMNSYEVWWGNKEATP